MLISFFVVDWFPPKTTNNLVYNPNNDETGVNPDLSETLSDGTPLDFYFLFASDRILNLLVVETNRYAEQKKIALAAMNKLKTYSRIKFWKNVDNEEMKVFLGALMYMDTVKLSSISDYWRTDGYVTTRLSKVMSRNRFESILSNFHCANNEEASTDRLHKIRGLAEQLEDIFQQWYIPGTSVCIDESMVPFQGRLVFKQFEKNKAHKFGIKVFKLCVDHYTLKYRIYGGKEKSPKFSVSENVVLEMMTHYLHFGRTLFCDNWYTSVSLAEKLLKADTHLVGTLRSNRSGNPAEVIRKKLKKNEYIARQNKSNVCVLKWRDKRDVLVLSTKHKDEFQTLQCRGREIKKPQIILDYNVGKSFVDRSDQMASYCSELRKSIKWYRKVAFNLLFSVSIINAHFLYQKVTGNRISAKKFKESVAEGKYNQINHYLLFVL